MNYSTYVTFVYVTVCVFITDKAKKLQTMKPIFRFRPKLIEAPKQQIYPDRYQSDRIWSLLP